VRGKATYGRPNKTREERETKKRVKNASNLEKISLGGWAVQPDKLMFVR